MVNKKLRASSVGVCPSIQANVQPSMQLGISGHNSSSGILLAVMGAFVLLVLTACGGSNSSSPSTVTISPQRGELATTHRADQVSNLYAVPGSGSVSLHWDNPTAIVAAFNVSVYEPINGGDVGNGALVRDASNSNITSVDGIETGPGAKGVTYLISQGLHNNHSYSFAVAVRLVGDADNTFRPAVRLQDRRNKTLPRDDFSIASANKPDVVVSDLVLIGLNRDGDEYADAEDSCPLTPIGLLGANDRDKDGCYGEEDFSPTNSSEFVDYDGDLLGDNIDPDDDNDNIEDINDSCPRGITNWKSNLLLDYDGDGCQNGSEDDDDDNDRIKNAEDSCARGAREWTSTPFFDHDRDGCRDADEDKDDDSDGVADTLDSCRLSPIGFISALVNDYDGDGCRDEDEDKDDDSDGIADTQDNCHFSPLGFISDSTTNDYDGDGCRNDRDTDYDGDGIANAQDNCRISWRGFISLPDNDYDGDGCRDADEDTDDDNDGMVDTLDNCRLSQLGFISNTTSDYDGDGCRDEDEDTDDDNDKIVDALDNCRLSPLGFISHSTNDYDGDGCRDEDEDTDVDSDGIVNAGDACRLSPLGFISHSTNDYDGDGCRDADADTDDDSDSITDALDSCRLSPLGFISNTTSDYNGDGCRDEDEDTDDDSDSIADALDACRLSSLGFISNTTSDYDGDGCRDEDEDTDDDSDSIADALDSCHLSQLGFISNTTSDYDGDGCRDEDEDTDVDSDGVADTLDACRLSPLGFTSNTTSDYDGDGCRDSDEDTDDDSDSIADTLDTCHLSPLGFISNTTSDYDGDGCRDVDEDTDDDSDSIADALDTCHLSPLGFISNTTSDYNGDGCRDADEDTDDDSDSIADALDTCALSSIGFISNITSDYDGDGCRDSDEDTDADSDSIADALDTCHLSPLGFISNTTFDYDGDGCRDADEDTDDDSDSIADTLDACRISQLGFISNTTSDYDGDGCRDADEDTDDDSDGIADAEDACHLSQLGFISNTTSDYDGDGCRDEEEDDLVELKLQNLRAFPGNQFIKLTWDNPDLDILSFNIAIDDLVYNAPWYDIDNLNASDGVNTAPNAKKVEYTIGTNGAFDTYHYLYNYYAYNITIIANLADTGISLTGVIGSIENPVVAGANYDKDEHIDRYDPCPATPANYLTDYSLLIDSDKDGCYDGEDMFPWDPTEWKDFDYDGVGNNADPDDDNDGFYDTIDVDDDRDGLIEIHSAAELDMIRNNLAGTGLSSIAGQRGSKIGCTGQVNGPASCNGYELANEIDLSPHGDWQPIGHCTGRDTSNSDQPICNADEMFASILEGNNYSIVAMAIEPNATQAKYGVGLFGAIANKATLRNVHILGMDIKRSPAGSWYVGGLAGVVDGGSIISSSAARSENYYPILDNNGTIIGDGYFDGGDVYGNSYVGGLVGFLHKDASVISSNILISTARGRSRTGGLIGGSYNSLVADSSARLIQVSSVSRNIDDKRLGGLVGQAVNSSILASSAVVKSVSTTRELAGGLVGLLDNSNVSSSYAIITSALVARKDLGGLIGKATGKSTISSSYAWTNYIATPVVLGVSPTDLAGGLVGNINHQSKLISSYAFSKKFGGSVKGGGLVSWGSLPGNLYTPVVINSYSLSPHALLPRGKRRGGLLSNSYWDRSITSVRPEDGDDSHRSISDLQQPRTFTLSFASWWRGWCDPATGVFTDNSETARAGGYDNNPAWDLGTSNQYPALTCFKDLSVEKQRELNSAR